MSKKRGRLEVIRDILEVIRARNGRIKPTHILYKSNLSYKMMDGYLKELIEKGMIQEQPLARGKTYVILDKGLKYLSEYESIAKFTENFGLKSE